MERNETLSKIAGGSERRPPFPRYISHRRAGIPDRREGGREGNDHDRLPLAGATREEERSLRIQALTEERTNDIQVLAA